MSKGIFGYLCVKDYAKAKAFYEKAFGAKETLRFDMPCPSGTGTIACHAELTIPSVGKIMLSEESPEWQTKSFSTLKGTCITPYFYVKNVDAAFQKAVAAGAVVNAPPATMYWGDRCARVVDPDGLTWSLMCTVEKLTPKQMLERHAEVCAGTRQMMVTSAPDKKKKGKAGGGASKPKAPAKSKTATKPKTASKKAKPAKK